MKLEGGRNKRGTGTLSSQRILFPVPSLRSNALITGKHRTNLRSHQGGITCHY